VSRAWSSWTASTSIGWGYACRAPGDPADAYASPNGGLLLCIWDENEFGD